MTISAVEFDPGCEAMIYTTDGTPLQGSVYVPLPLVGTHLKVLRRHNGRIRRRPQGRIYSHPRG
jgi:hypothetical protein